MEDTNTDKILKVVIKLRRDSEANFAAIKDTFIPLNGEICLIDTANSGMRVVCGDGTKVLSQLSYIDLSLLKGYYFENKFYTDVSHTKEMIKHPDILYLDLPNDILYYYNGTTFKKLTDSEAQYWAEQAQISAQLAGNYATQAGNKAVEAINAADEAKSVVWKGTQAQYNALPVINPNTIYFIVG